MQYLISGKVIHGDDYGKKLGFPTVNLHIEDTELLPMGVYAGTATLDKIEYRAGIVISKDLSRAKSRDKIEAHLIGYNGDAYGKIVALEIKDFIREYKNFDTEAELINQIKEDLKKC